MNILLLGPGKMGEPMAELLLAAGKRVEVLQHRNPEPVKRLVSHGASKVEDLQTSAARADVVFCVLPNLTEINEILFENDVAGAMKKGSLFLSMSTVSPSGIQKTMKRLTDAGIETLDAPVSGGTAKAADGTLTIMAGGERATFDTYFSLLQILGESIHYTGGIGTGQVVKLCNNLLAAIIMTANAEILTLGVKAGANAKQIQEIVLQSTGSNRLLDDWISKTMLQNQYEPGFALRLMDKDIDLALGLARSTQTPAFLGGIIQQLFGTLMGKSESNLDYSVISTVYQQAAGIRISDGQPYVKE